MKDNDLLKKWLNNALTDAEKEAFRKQDDYALNQTIIDKAQHFKASHFSQPEDFESFKNKYHNTSKVKRLQWIGPLLRIAAIVVIGWLVYTNFLKENLVNARTLAHEKTQLNLPDQSIVQLNADSEIAYNNDGWTSHRSLNLKGEAYFKVTKGATFDVVTPQGTVTVVGTEFNVKSRSNYFEVICYEGSVRVTSDTLVRQLLAGDTFRVLNQKFSNDRVKHIEPQWIHNHSDFKAIPLNEVFNEIERQYGVSVTLKSNAKTRLFTGGFSHDHLEDALIAITQPMNLTYDIKSSTEVFIHDKKD